MPTSKTRLKLDSSGQYARQIGWLTGRSGQKKFRLGRDLRKAEVAHYKLGLLWQVVETQHERHESAVARSGFGQQGDERPVWTDDALVIAEAIRKHQHEVRVPRPARILDDTAYMTYLDGLRQRVGHLISVLPADREAAERGREIHRFHAEHRSRKARLSARIAEVPVPLGVTGSSLYQALDDYAIYAQQQNKREGGRIEAANTRRLKDSIGDMDLGEFGYTAMETIKTYWASRPEAKTPKGEGSGKPISISTVNNHLKTARRFVRWLDRSDTFDWELPRHGLDAMTVNLQRLQTDAEVAERRHGVKVLTVPQLATIYEHATDFERLLVLLGLNAAMAQAEITTLRWDEVEPGVIKRIRRKVGVYAEFALWPETEQALEWWSRVRPAGSDLVMVSGEGNPYNRHRISNTWAKLRKRIERETGQPADWWLPFKHLRKTAAQLVRDASDGEVAGTFLSHGQPVASDELADVYSNRPFDKVGAALGDVRDKLKKVFKTALDAFTGEKVGQGPKRR